MKNLIALSFILAAVSGCTSLATIETYDAIYDKTTQGKFDVYPYCVVDKLEHHKSRRMRNLNYKVRVIQYKESATIAASIRDEQDIGVFIMEINQTDSDRIRTTIKGNKKGWGYYNKQAIQAADNCLSKINH